jgi:hypothetical protein
MPRTGRPPTPTAKLKLTGGFRADRHGSRLDAVVEVTPELPPCPSWLTSAAAEHWPEVGAMLHGLNIMGRPHTLALAMLVESLAEYIADRNPKTRDQVHKWCREFGMTPSAITSIRSVPKQDEKPKGLARLKLAQ